MSAGQSLPDVCFEAADGDPYLGLAVAVQAVQAGYWPGLPVAYPAIKPEKPVEPQKRRRRSTPAELHARRPLVAKLYADGHGKPTIARMLGVSLAIVARDLDALGVPRRQAWKRSTPEKRAARELLAVELYSRGLNLAEVAEKLGANPTTVYMDLIRRGVKPRSSGTYRRGLTHCPHGHPYDEVNTYVTPEGHRQCRVCRDRHRRESAARAAA